MKKSTWVVFFFLPIAYKGPSRSQTYMYLHPHLFPISPPMYPVAQTHWPSAIAQMSLTGLLLPLLHNTCTLSCLEGLLFYSIALGCLVFTFNPIRTSCHTIMPTSAQCFFLFAESLLTTKNRTTFLVFGFKTKLFLKSSNSIPYQETW